MYHCIILHPFFCWLNLQLSTNYRLDSLGHRTLLAAKDIIAADSDAKRAQVSPVATRNQPEGVGAVQNACWLINIRDHTNQNIEDDQNPWVGNPI